MVSKYRPVGSSASTVPRAPIEDIEAALQSVVRTLNQVRVHDRLLRAASVHVDRAGSALLYRLSVEPDGLRVTDLAERLGVDAPTVTRKVQQLEREGLVARREDPFDRRASRLGLTPEGKRIIAKVLAARRAWLTRLLAGWDQDDQAQFARLLSRFGEALTRDLDDKHELDDTHALDKDISAD
jgi:DNA-binding MarR family transcriptional regulator